MVETRRSCLIEDILGEVEPKPAQDVRVGLKYTAVEIDGKIGLAYNFCSQFSPPFKNAGTLLGKPTIELARSWDFTEASVGCASINASLRPKDLAKREIFAHILGISEDYEKIGVVGLFPFVEELKRRGDVYLFERKPVAGALPDTAVETLLPKCDLVVISGSTFVNKTLERLLEISEGYTLVIGPTTPLTPILFEYGADLLAGAVVKGKRALEVVSQGGGTREFGGAVEDVVMER
jgi:hypothetical protein